MYLICIYTCIPLSIVSVCIDFYSITARSPLSYTVHLFLSSVSIAGQLMKRTGKVQILFLNYCIRQPWNQYIRISISHLLKYVHVYVFVSEHIIVVICMEEIASKDPI